MKKSKWIIGTVILVVVIGGFTITNVLGKASPASVSYTELYQGELVNSISTKGTVESIERRNVYTKLGFTIKEVNVKVNDQVTEGQVLCVLDTGDLELDIAQKKADLDALQRSNLNQLQNNQRLYNEAASNLNSGKNTQVLSADSAFNTAVVNLEKAQKDYDDALKEKQDGTNAGLTTAKSNLVNAELSLDTAKTTFDNNKILYDAGAIAQDTYTQTENALITAQNKYNDALTSLENAETSEKKTLEQYESALKTAQINCDNATATKTAAQVTANQNLETYQNSIQNSQIAISNNSQVIAIQKLEKQIEDSVIKSPISGTVTAVYAKEGAPGNGLMFVIEDTDNLQITTKIEEYDVGHVKTGMPIAIKTDSTGDADYEGVLSKISSTAIKNASGETDTTDDIEFEATVDVVSPGTDLKVGLNARLTVIVEKKENVYYVPSDAVTTNGNGESIVFIAAGSTQDKYTAKQVVITTGMETDFYTEITGAELADGVKVISDASAIQDGIQIILE